MKLRKRRKLFRILLWLVILAATTFAGLIGYICLQEGNVMKTVPESEQYDAIIVLGAQIRPDGTPSIQLSWRLDAAAEAYQQKKVPVVVCGAQGRDEPVTEAEGMKDYLLEKEYRKKIFCKIRRPSIPIKT